jgi:hypothetical protein
MTAILQRVWEKEREEVGEEREREEEDQLLQVLALSEREDFDIRLLPVSVREAFEEELADELQQVSMWWHRRVRPDDPPLRAVPLLATLSPVPPHVSVGVRVWHSLFAYVYSQLFDTPLEVLWPLPPDLREVNLVMWSREVMGPAEMRETGAETLRLVRNLGVDRALQHCAELMQGRKTPLRELVFVQAYAREALDQVLLFQGQMETEIANLE